MKAKKRYNPFQQPNPQDWLALDEHERITMVERYHRRKRIELPNTRLHAAMHTVVENQVAMGPELPVQATLQRLLSEGLDRHEAIHAIASVLVTHMYDALTGSPPADTDPNEAYFRDLEALSADGWRNAVARVEAL